jgi:hypothetical protein
MTTATLWAWGLAIGIGFIAALALLIAEYRHARRANLESIARDHAKLDAQEARSSRGRKERGW